MPNIAEALIAVDNARSSREYDEKMADALAQIDQVIDCCEQLGWRDIAFDLVATRARFAKRRRNVTRH